MTKKKQQPEEPESKCTISTTETVQLHIPVRYVNSIALPLIHPTTTDLGNFLHAVWAKLGPNEYEVNVCTTGLIAIRATDQ